MRRPTAFAVVVTAVATMATALSVVASAPARAADNPTPNRLAPGVLMTTDERDCREVTVPRPVDLAAVQALLGDGWTANRLPTPAPAPRGAVYVDDYVCESTTVNGIPASRRTVSTFALALARRGSDPTLRYYLLWWGTDNPLVFSRMRQAGLPVSYLPHSTATITSDGATTTVRYDLVGAGLDHTLTASMATIPPGEISVDPAGDFGYWYRTPGGDVRLAFDNTAYPPFPATVNGDLTTASRFAALRAEGFSYPLVDRTFPTASVVGSWRGTLYAPTG